MNPRTTLLASILTSATVATGAIYVADDLRDTPAPKDTLQVESRHRRELQRFEDTVAKLAARVDALGSVASLSAPSRVAAPAVEESVDATTSAAAAEVPGVELDHDSARLDLDGARAEILDAGFDSERAGELWSAAAEEDRVADLLEVFRLAAEADPGSPEAQWDLARAALAAARTDPNHPEGIWWRESDEAYGRVIELDTEHHDARYEKAKNLMFWPDAFGRQPEAIRHFERLRANFDGLSDARHSQTFVWLGNLYAQQGRLDDARAVWQEGLGYHPDDTTLAAKLESDSD